MNPRNHAGLNSTSGLDDAALQADNDCVGAIIRPQLGKDALYMVLNSILGDVELVGNNLVRISFRYAP